MKLFCVEFTTNPTHPPKNKIHCSVSTIFVNIFVLFMINALIASVYQCLEGTMVDPKCCPDKAGYGGCDGSSIGSFVENNYIIWTESHWFFMQNQCKRACKLCLDNF